MLTERISSPSDLQPGKKFFTVMHYSYPEGHTDIISMSLEQTQMTEQGFDSKRLEVAIDYTHTKQRESTTAYYAYNLSNAHFFDAFKQQDNTQVQDS